MHQKSTQDQDKFAKVLRNPKPLDTSIGHKTQRISSIHRNKLRKKPRQQK